MFISICPNFFCNLNCTYCYLGKHRKNNNILSLPILKNNLDDILNTFKNIEAINIFGGEISLLSEDYLVELNNLCKKYTKNIYITTNGLNDNIFNIFDNFSISYNEERKSNNIIKHKLLYFEKNYNLSIVLLPSILNDNPQVFFDSINHSNCKHITFQFYSPSVTADKNYMITDKEQAECLKRYLTYYLKNNNKYFFKITNLYTIKDCLLKRFDPLQSSNIFILPNGSFASIKYTNTNLEYFKPYTNINAFIEDCQNEIFKYKQKCSSCKYYKHCYTEHLNLNKKCSGYKSLLDYFEKNETFNNIFKINKSM